MTFESIISAARSFGGCWLDLFRYEPRRDRWFFTPPFGGDPCPVRPEKMPDVAARLGGWPRDPEAQPVYFGGVAA